MKKFLKKHLVEIIICLMLLAGLGLVLYPTVSDWWNDLHQSRAIASYIEDVENVSDDDKLAMLEAAQIYNERLAKAGNNFLPDEAEEAEYLSLLDVSGTGIMGYIQIPSIDVNLPIYHGTDEGVLQIGVGHITGSSLPVGGKGSHCLLSGHRGLPSARLFTDLDQMEEGNIFLLNVLGETYTYQVDQIRIVLPEELDELTIVDGKDYCTLITCTPYGVNTHRILVRGHRIENNAETEQIVMATEEAVRVPTSVVGLVIGLPLMAVVLIGVLIHHRLKRPKKDEKEILEDLRNI